MYRKPTLSPSVLSPILTVFMVAVLAAGYGTPAEATATEKEAKTEEAKTGEAKTGEAKTDKVAASLKVVDNKDSGFFVALTGKDKKPLNLYDFEAMRESYCWASKAPSFEGVRTQVEFSGLPEGTEFVAKLSGSSKTFEDDYGYIECDPSGLKPLGEVKVAASGAKGSQSIDITPGSSAAPWSCTLQIEISAVHQGKTLVGSEKKSMGITCPE